MDSRLRARNLRSWPFGGGAWAFTAIDEARLEERTGNDSEALVQPLRLLYSPGMAALRTVRGLLFGALSFGWLIFVLNPIQVASLAVRPFSRPHFRAINRWCAGQIWGFWAWMAEHWNGIEVVFSGDPLPPPENALVLSNHQSMADVMVLLCFARRTGRIGDLKWFVKDPVKWVPGPGWGMKLLDCIYVKRDWTKDQAEIGRLFGKFSEERIPIALVSFLEGTRRTPAKQALAVAYAEERGLVPPRRVLVPRTKGFVATMQGLRSHLDAVHDLTIRYPGPVPTLFDCFAARVPRVEVHVRRHPVASLPVDPEALTQWAHARFADKDAWLGAHEAPEPGYGSADADGVAARTAL